MRGITIARAQGNAERRVVASPRRRAGHGPRSHHAGGAAGADSGCRSRGAGRRGALCLPETAAFDGARSTAVSGRGAWRSVVAYLDSSVLLRHVLLGEEPIRHALAFPRVVSSELIEIECRRVLHRCRLAGELDDAALAVARERLDAVLFGIDLLELSTQMKQRAMDPFPVQVRTLDALHIATALAVARRRRSRRSGVPIGRAVPATDRGADCGTSAPVLPRGRPGRRPGRYP